MSRSSLAWPLCLALTLTAGAARSQDIQNAAWPSLDRQLEADRVAFGSALERLIEENQDFHLLRSEEALDGIPIPLWLRVLWRKQHPHLEYRADDPTGGYPRVLQDAHAWMVSHQDLRPGLDEPDVVADEVTVGAPERSISPIGTRSTSSIRINTWNPVEILAASNNLHGIGLQALYRSTDGGNNWGHTTLPPVGQDFFHAGPTVDWTSDGTAWTTTLGITANLKTLRVRLYRSTDKGATWVFDSTVTGTQTTADKQMTWVDSSPASPYLDTMYAIWHNGRPVYMNRKKRSGTWGAPVKVSGSETTGTGIGGDVNTNSAGVVFGFWPDTGSRKIYMVKSTNGGQSYSKPKAIASTFDSFDIGIPAMNKRRALLYVTAGTYKTATKDMVYVVWADLSGASGCRASSNEPGSNVASACKTRIWLTRSTDGGATWSAKKMINNQAGKNDQLNPWLAVDETTGTVGVVYYDTVGPARRKTNVWYQSSSNDGAAWSAPFKVTSQPTDETTDLANPNQYGDYNGLSGYAGTFFPSWTDRRDELETEKIWTATLLDQPATCTPPAAPANLRAAVNGNHRIDLTWNAVAGAREIRVYRSAVGSGPFTQIAALTPWSTAWSDRSVVGGTVYVYVVRAAAATCESGNSNQVLVTAQGGGGGSCTTTALYSSDFEGASGLAAWMRGVFDAGSSADDWRGAQSCPAKSGSRLFRFGGLGCSSDYGNNRFAFAQPGGEAGITVPVGANQVQLSFWHRYDFEDDRDGALISVSLDGQNGYFFVPPVRMSGKSYDGIIHGGCAPAGTSSLPVFTGRQTEWVNTVVDLDTMCSAIDQITGQGPGICAGRTLHIGFTTITDCLISYDGWFLDDVQVTACVP